MAYRLRWMMWMVLAAMLLAGAPLSALITSGGKDAVRDYNWPQGAVGLANLASRFGFWEGPPFGGGEWQFAYRGDAVALQQALEVFARIRAPELRVIIHEGNHIIDVLKSEGPNGSGRADWTFTVWDPNSWNNLYNNPKSVWASEEPGGKFRRPVDPPTMDVYVAGKEELGLDWEKITVPAGVTVIDERATSAGYKAEDSSVIKGDVFDMATSKPVPEARIVLAKYLVKGDNAQGTWETIVEGKTDETGAFEMKKVPAGSYQVTVEAHDYTARWMGYASIGNNTLKKYQVQLARPATVKGAVHDTAGKPVAGMKLVAHAVMGRDGRGYLLGGLNATTDADGQFELLGLPDGFFQLHGTMPGLYLPNPFQIHDTRNADLQFAMTATGTVKGKVLRGTKNGAMFVRIGVPGDEIGTWGGSKMTDLDGSFIFDNVPPGKYLVSSDSRPTRISEGKEVVVKEKETTEVEVQGF